MRRLERALLTEFVFPSSFMDMLMTSRSQSALILIDLQNDYFDGFAFPLWQADAILERSLAAIKLAKTANIPILFVQHVADASKGAAPFFNEGTEGVELHPRLRAAAPDASIIRKRTADAFRDTELEPHLADLGVSKLLVGGMMTQNCVTHTAISRAADRYEVTVLSDLSTTVSEMIHLIALNALSPMVSIATSNEIFGQN